MSISIRPATQSDAEACGQIIYQAFRSIAAEHGFPPDFPSVDAATELARAFIDNPTIFGIVAEEDGRIVGSNFLSEGDAVRGVGPITVDPTIQGKGIGRRLMRAVLDRTNGADGIRLLQDSFNMRSLSLYASLGFEVREPVVVMAGRPLGEPLNEIAVRPMREDDLDDCEALCLEVHAISRRHEVRDAVHHFRPLVAQRGGRIVAYMTAPTFWIANHGLASTEGDMRALILGAGAIIADPLSFLLPIRQAALFRWCLDQGLRAVKPMTLMTIGDYRTPVGAYVPCVLY